MPLFSSSTLQPALRGGASYYLVLLAAQLSILCGYLIPAGSLGWAAFRYLFTLPFLQTQNLIAAALFAGLVLICSLSRRTRWIPLPVLILLTVASLLNQVYFKLFLDHIHLSLFEGGQGFTPSLMIGSFVRELDAPFWCSLGAALASCLWFALALRRDFPLPVAMVWRRALAVAALFLLAGAPSAFQSTRYVHLNEHPIWSFLRDWRSRDLAEVLAERRAAPSPAAATSSGEIDTDPRLGAFARQGNKPNLVLIVLESVGSTALLGQDGLPRPLLTPTLAALTRQGVLFDQIYAPFPGSTRSLISLHTGGKLPTTGGRKELSAQFTGATIPRVLGGLGYRTALFSSQRLDGEFTDVFMQGIGFTKLHDFARDVNSLAADYYIHSWGAREEYTVGRIQDWLQEQKSSGAPFFLEYYTAATHHPYGAPPGFPLVAPPAEPQNDFRNALHYTDRNLANLLNWLRTEGLLRNTVVLVTGDHGEAFGDLHSRNRLHRDYIYDENVRVFLIVSDGRAPGERALVSHRVAGNGEILATLQALATGGQDRGLLADSYPSRPVFFHNRAIPEKWGVREGRWKYIGQIRSEADPELFDLAADPAERQNLASRNPGRVARFRQLCEEWIIRANEEYNRHIK